MYQLRIYEPPNFAWIPFNGEMMEGLRRVKSQFDDSWRPSITVVEFRSIASRVIEHIDEKMVGLIPEYFHIDLLSR